MANVLQAADFSSRSVRLDTLVRLRWLAVAGQTAAVLVVAFGLGFELPIALCFALIVLSAVVNLILRIRYPASLRLANTPATALLGYDVLQLAGLLFLTGGLENPFAILLLVPVIVSATTLAPRPTFLLGAIVVAFATVLGLVHWPLPWYANQQLPLPLVYVVGVWLALVSACVFTGVYAFRVAEEARQLAEALAATERVLAREQHLSQLDGLAAAAAHELGTPLSTISVIVKELELALEANSPHIDDVRLLREQSQRCRDILAKLSELSTGEPFDRVPLAALIEEVVAPHRNFGIAIDVALQHDSGWPMGARNPAILYGLGNLLENAVDFAQGRVEVTADWSDEEVVVTISDDGPGFAPEVMDRIGDPYVRSSKRRRMNAGSETTGLGLGFFIAKTLLERSGATVDFENRAYPDRGAVIRVHWNRSDFERPLGVAGP